MHEDNPVFSLEQYKGWHILSVKQVTESHTDFTWLKTKIEELCASQPVHIAVLFARKSYLYSKIISVLVVCSNIVKKNGGRFACIRPDKNVNQTLEALKLKGNVLEIFQTREEVPFLE